MCEVYMVLHVYLVFNLEAYTRRISTLILFAFFPET